MSFSGVGIGVGAARGIGVGVGMRLSEGCGIGVAEPMGGADSVATGCWAVAGVSVGIGVAAGAWVDVTAGAGLDVAVGVTGAVFTLGVTPGALNVVDDPAGTETSAPPALVSTVPWIVTTVVSPFGDTVTYESDPARITDAIPALRTS